MSQSHASRPRCTVIVLRDIAPSALSSVPSFGTHFGTLVGAEKRGLIPLDQDGRDEEDEVKRSLGGAMMVVVGVGCFRAVPVTGMAMAAAVATVMKRNEQMNPSAVALALALTPSSHRPHPPSHPFRPSQLNILYQVGMRSLWLY